MHHNHCQLRNRMCLTPGAARCDKPAKLQCPKCLSQGLPKEGSVFCSQDCFKVSHGPCSALLPRRDHCMHCSPCRRAACYWFRIHMQEAWVEHKKVHQKPVSDGWMYVTKRGRGRAKAMPSYNYTGALRPHPVSPTSEVCLGSRST